MAVKGFNSKWFSDICERESYWILMYFISEHSIDQLQAHASVKDRGRILDSCVDNWQQYGKNITKEESSKLCSDIKILCKQSILKDQEFEWLDKNNPRMCYWAWLYVNKFPLLPPQPIQPNQYSRYMPRYTRPPLQQVKPILDYGSTIDPVYPTNSQERIDQVIRVFDFNFPGDANYKRQYLEKMKTQWARCFEFNKFHLWLEQDNEKQIKWAWDHLPRNIFHYTQQPTSVTEQYLAIVGAFDTWHDHFAVLEQIVSKAKRAWSQKKHRDKRGDKKAYSFVISQDAKNKLDTIARITDKKLSEVIEKIIDHELDRLKKSGSNNIEI
ncbi:hypothetical protein [Thalassotalea aquiviva]|uniref:hypothetical protein n=1 Tax=Thalassotalea aquiviva TaxID=3242415 RepID=UPI003529FA56